MMLTWMIYAIALGLLLALAGVVLEHAAQLMRWPARWSWLGTLSLMLFMPALGLLPGATRSPTITAAPLNVVSYGLSSVVSSATAGHALAAPSMGTVLVGLWLLASLAILGIAIVGQIRVRREIAGLAEVRLEGAVVRVSRSTGPAVVGLLRPVIVVPDWVRSLDVERRRYVIEHECAHAKAGDTWLLYSAMALVALMPWNPAMWWAAKRLRDAVELDCDQRLVRSGASVGTYGTLLIDVAGRGFAALGAVAPFIGRTSLLARRIEMLMRGTARARVLRTVLALAAGGALVIVACQTKRPEPTSPPAAAGTPSDTTMVYVQRGPLDTGQKGAPPVLLSRPEAAYPPLMRQAGITGRVAVTFVVRKDGRVDTASIRVTRSTNRAFDQAAKDAIARSTFKPARIDGRAVSAYVSQDVAFALEGRPAPEFSSDTTMIFVDTATHLQLRPSTVPVRH
ncbi:MAG TPA: M56 family metallopeptidase [Gemmatimonadales bacterium]|nr:M56 family metallopeptidase [Gemmatimonadales bacterium]